MSLPSIVIFLKEGKEVKRFFTNCGWFANDNSIKRGIKTSLENINENFDWDTAAAYGKIYTKKEIESYES